MPPAHIEVRDLSKRWRTRDGSVAALERVSLSVAPQEFLTVLGPSGCGKSTLLMIVGGLVSPDGGEVRVAGARFERPDPRQVAMVFQDPGLFPWRTALENVEFGLELQGVPAATRREVARGLLEPVGLRGFERRYPRELSGGTRRGPGRLHRAGGPGPDRPGLGVVERVRTRENERFWAIEEVGLILTARLAREAEGCRPGPREPEGGA